MKAHDSAALDPLLSNAGVNGATGQYARIVFDRFGESEGQRILDIVKALERHSRSSVGGWLAETMPSGHEAMAERSRILGVVSLQPRYGPARFTQMELGAVPLCLWICGAVAGQGLEVVEESFSPDIDDHFFQASYMAVARSRERSGLRAEIWLDTLWSTARRSAEICGYRINLFLG